MDISNNIVPDNYHTVIEIGACDIHTFTNKTKSIVALGACEILGTHLQNETPDNSNPYYLRVKTYCQPVKSSHTFVKIQYPNTTSYLFQNSDLLISAISFNKQQLGLDKFENLLSELCKVLEFSSPNIEEGLKIKIKESCPDNIETQDISSDPKKNVKAVGKTIGALFGTINSYVSQPAKSVGNSVSQRADRFSRDSLSEQTKTKWNTIKEKSSNFNDSVSNIIRPVVNGYYNISDTIGQKFYNSQNTVIKAVREYSLAFAESINEAESKTRDPQKHQQEELKEQGPSQNQLN